MPRSKKKKLVKKDQPAEVTYYSDDGQPLPPNPTRGNVIELLRTLDETLDSKLDLAQDNPTQQILLYHNVERPSRTPPCPSDNPAFRYMIYVSASPQPKP